MSHSGGLGLSFQRLEYSKTNINAILSLRDPEEVEKRIRLCAMYGDINAMLSYYLSTYDVIDWQLAASMVKYCNYETIIEQTVEEHCISRLTYLKNGDV